MLVLLLAGAEVQQQVHLRLQKHVFEPVHVALQGCRLEVLHHLPHRWHHRVPMVAQGGEAHHDRQLFVRVLTGLQEVRHIGVHLWRQLKAIQFLKGGGIKIQIIS